MVPEELAAICLRERIKGLYLMPEVQNPTTSALTAERRARIARIVLRNDLILMEDDAFGHTGRREATLSARLPENGIFLGGTSKVFGAGLRVSFVAAPSRFVAPLERGILSTVWMASPLNVEIATRTIASGKAEAQIRVKTGRQRDARRSL